MFFNRSERLEILYPFIKCAIIMKVITMCNDFNLMANGQEEIFREFDQCGVRGIEPQETFSFQLTSSLRL